MKIKEKIALWIAKREIRKRIERLIERPFTKGENIMLGHLINAFANWQTTLLGIAAGATNLMINGMDWKHALQSAFLMAIGIVAKDASTGSKVGK